MRQYTSPTLRSATSIATDSNCSFILVPNLVVESLHDNSCSVEDHLCCFVFDFRAEVIDVDHLVDADLHDLLRTLVARVVRGVQDSTLKVGERSSIVEDCVAFRVHH